jgi:hypothetical protein
MCCKYDIIFTNIVATGQFAWVPSQENLFDEDEVRVDGLRNTKNEISILRKEVAI